MKGLIHIYCGDGKGKTTAAIGLAVRACGCGQNVLLTRFLKTDQSGEVAALSSLPGITVTPCEKSFGFFFQMDEEKKAEARSYYSGLFKETAAKAQSGGYDLLVLDEIIVVCNFGLVDEKEVVRFLKEKPENLEVVLTGRDPSQELVELSDYLSEIKKVRHPYDAGIKARQGIEY